MGGKIFLFVHIGFLWYFFYIGCTKEGSLENQATYEIKENDDAIFEFQCRIFIAKHIDKAIML